MNKEEIEKEEKISIPLLTQEEINGIDINMNEFINQFTKMLIKEKDLAIAQHIIQRQQEKIEKLEQKESKLNKVTDKLKEVKEIALEDKEKKKIIELPNGIRYEDKVISLDTFVYVIDNLLEIIEGEKE